MDIKSLPIDNMYKFISVFCIALLLASTYSTLSIQRAYSDRIFSLYEKAIELDSKKEEMKAKNKQLSIYDKEMRGYYLGTI